MIEICYKHFNNVFAKNMFTSESKTLSNIILGAFCINVLNVKSNLNGNIKKSDVIYMLEWMPLNIHEPIDYLELQQKSFFNRQCLKQNCFLTENRSHFSDLTDFDVILFNVINLRTGMALPEKRSENQIYVLFGMEHLGYCPLSTVYNGFFNMTWTYKLDSDSPFPYIAVKDKFGEVIGPKQNMVWMDISEMKPVSKYVRRKIRYKKTAAAWIVSHCDTVNQRYEFVEELQKYLARYNQTVDIYGRCGKSLCPLNEGVNECYGLLESDYYFYLAFENSFHSDYVTEKLLHGLKHFAVPIVYGGANYTRFMPDGMYLNARELGPEKLAKEMNNIIKNKCRYRDFFKWHRHYSYHDTAEDAYANEICGYCAALNDVRRRKEKKVYENITDWWNGTQDLQDTCIDLRPILPDRTRDRS